jgi:hypothetical protein
MQFYTTFVEVEGWSKRFAVHKDDNLHCNLNGLGGHGRILTIGLAEVNYISCACKTFDHTKYFGYPCMYLN